MANRRTHSLITLCVLAGCTVHTAQDTTRQIWDSAFRQKRPEAAKPTDRRSPASGVDYRASGPLQPSGPTTRVVGFTMWRLRPAGRADVAPRLLVQEPGEPRAGEYVPERLPPGATLRVGDRVRLGIEVAHEGYLYVIDRERFADGTRGTPHLIFPARRLRNGDNRIEPGRLVEIPDQRDPVPALRLQRSDPRYVGEELLVIVTTRPLADLPIADREVALPADRVAQWERQWGADSQRLDQLSTGDGRSSWTTAEQAAGLEQRLLTQDDPLPASLFRVVSDADGLMVRIPLLVE